MKKLSLVAMFALGILSPISTIQANELKLDGNIGAAFKLYLERYDSNKR